MVASTPFTTFPFRATNATASRTMPNRLAEIHNVLDFGADPTGSSDSTSAIQAAVDVVSGAGRGTVYFPLGTYHVSAPITFNYSGASICFRGEGGGTTISASPSFNGFIFDRHLGTPSNTAFVLFELMSIQNSNSGSSSGAIRLGSTTQGAIRYVGANGFTAITTEDSAGNSSQNIFIEGCKIQSDPATGTRGLIIGGSGAVLGCDFISSDIAVLAYGNGLHMAGNRIENAVTAYQLGLDSAGTNAGMSGFSINGSTEGNLTCVDMAGACTGGFIGPIGMLGHSTSGPNQNQHSLYGLRVRADCARGCVFYNVSPNSWFDTAGISIANATSRADNVFIACDSDVGAGTGVAWDLPTNAYTAQFLQCNTQPTWTFSQLPTGGNVLEGDEFNISDSNTNTWGATAAGSGSNHVLVRYNGTNWTVVGK